jgi:4-fold beta-flower domain-containing protein
METTVYDVHRRARIYLADDAENSIYTWDGHAVAWLDGEQVYGWRGRHLGWFVAGILYDGAGYRVGFTAETCPEETYAEPPKYAKHRHTQRFTHSAPYARPTLSQGNSSQDLDEFIRQDAP